MKKLFSIFTALLIGAGSIALAMSVNQEDPICLEPDHEGYIYTPNQTPPLPFNPDAPLPSGMEAAGIYEEEFECESAPDELCHWVYKPAQGNEPAKWIPCQGKYVDLR